MPISLKSFGSLSATFCGHRHARGVGGELAVVERAVRSAREALRRFARGRTPDRRSSASPRPRPAWFAPSRRPGAAAARTPRIAFELPVACIAEQRIGVELLVRRRVLELHLVEVHLQLLGDQHRDRGVGALAHLDVGHGQDDLRRRASMRMKAFGAKVSAASAPSPAGQAAGRAAGRRRRRRRPAGSCAARDRGDGRAGGASDDRVMVSLPVRAARPA